MKALKHWLFQLLIALDQLFNVLLSPCSMQAWADETISSRCGRLGHRAPYKRLKALIDAIFHPFQGPGHCDLAYQHELARYQLPPDMRHQAQAAEDQARPERVF